MDGLSFRAAGVSAVLAVMLLGGVVRAHIPDTMVVELELEETRWVATAEMDVKFAVAALMRHYVPEDTGEGWVENLNAGQLVLIKEVTEKFFRERLQLSMNGERLAMEVRFPAYEKPTLSFAVAPNGEPVTPVVMEGLYPGTKGPLTVRWEGRWGPSLVLEVREPGKEEAEIHTVALGGTVVLGGGAEPEAAGERRRGWSDWVVSGIRSLLRWGGVHVLFIVGFLLPVRGRGALVRQAACFTGGHSLTLWLVGQGVVAVPAGLVEPLLVLSVLYIGIENLFLREPSPWRLGMISGFGLIHGVGLALVARGLAGGAGPPVPPLLGFHLGVELGQVLLIGIAVGVAVPLVAAGVLARVRVLGSAAIASTGLFWAVTLVVS